MAKNELLTELKGGQAQFTLVGKANIKEDSLKGATVKEGKTWRHVDSSFSVSITKNNTVFVRLWGGYKTDNPVLKRFNTDNVLVDIPWEDRFNEAHLENTRFQDKFTAGLERDEEGKLIMKEFLSEIDFEEYLREHLANGMDVRVRGDVEYSQGNNDTIYTRYNLKSVYAVEEYTDSNGVFHPIVPEATLRQTYLVEDSSLARGWEKELSTKGETVLSVLVPQYMSQKKVGDKYITYKKTVAIPQALKIKADLDNERDVEMKTKLAKMLFQVKRNVVREITVFAKIFDGYESVTGEVEVTKELQELIDMGVLSIEEVQKQATVRGTRKTELVFSLPVMRKDEDGKMTVSLNDDKYAPEALIAPAIDGEDDNDSSGDSEEVTVTEDELAALFDM